MNDLEQSVLNSLDGKSKDLLPFIPYILQDLWEMGTDPKVICKLIKESIKRDFYNILDLGCGKGAVSVKLAAELNCKITGIDGVPEFIKEAETYAAKFNVNEKCRFTAGDIRNFSSSEKFDIVILGAIGQVFGNMFETLKKVTNFLQKDGFIIIDDGYISDDETEAGRQYLRKKDFFTQIEGAGFAVIKEEISEFNCKVETDEIIFRNIEKRIGELKLKYPEKEHLFEEYLQAQINENDTLENLLTTGTWLLKRE